MIDVSLEEILYFYVRIRNIIDTFLYVGLLFSNFDNSIFID